MLYYFTNFQKGNQSIILMTAIVTIFQFTDKYKSNLYNKVQTVSKVVKQNES